MPPGPITGPSAWRGAELARRVGLGLRWGLTFPGVVSVKPQFEVYFGYRLRDVKTVGRPDSLQDALVSKARDQDKAHAGVHFQFLLAVF